MEFRNILCVCVHHVMCETTMITNMSAYFLYTNISFACIRIANTNKKEIEVGAQRLG